MGVCACVCILVKCVLGQESIKYPDLNFNLTGFYIMLVTVNLHIFLNEFVINTCSLITLWICKGA